jgi:hypothetical protein
MPMLKAAGFYTAVFVVGTATMILRQSGAMLPAWIGHAAERGGRGWIDRRMSEWASSGSL